jgi:SRSO17 transposase
VQPYTPARWFARGEADPDFRTKPRIALELVERAVQAGVPFQAVVADSFYGENLGFIEGLEQFELGYVLALRPSHAWWHPQGELGSVEQVARSQPWQPEAPGAWQKITRSFRDGHQEEWWALEAAAGPYGPTKTQRMVIATTDPITLPELTTWYLLTNLPAPEQARKRSLPAASLTEVVRLYGLRVWVEQSYKQVKQSLGWAQYQVRSDLAIRRHWQLVCCAFSFCWWACAQEDGWELDQASQPAPEELDHPGAAQGEKKMRSRSAVLPLGDLARGSTASAGVVGAMDHAAALLASVVHQAPTSPAAGAA